MEKERVAYGSALVHSKYYQPYFIIWFIKSNLQIVPWGIRKHLNWIKNTYGNPEIVITENGLSDNNGTLADDHRIAYIRVRVPRYFVKHIF